MALFGESPGTSLPVPTTILAVTLFQDVFFHEVVLGMKAETKKLGVSLLLGNSNNDLQVEGTLVTGAAARGAQAILISPVNEVKSAGSLEKASQSGLKIVTYNDSVRGDFVSSRVSSGQVQLGASTGESARKYILGSLGGKANLAIVCFDSLLPAQSKARVQGFLDAVTKGLPGVRVVLRTDSWEAGPAIKVVTDFLEANPGIDVIFSANEGGTIGSVLAVRNSFFSNRVKVFGTDASKQELDMLMAPDDILQAVTAQQPFQIGVAAVDEAVAELKGRPPVPVKIVPGVLLSRENPESLKAWNDQHPTP